MTVCVREPPYTSQSTLSKRPFVCGNSIHINSFHRLELSECVELKRNAPDATNVRMGENRVSVFSCGE